MVIASNVFAPAPLPAFTTAELTQTVNVLPNLFGDINNSNLFDDVPVTQVAVFIEQAHGVLNLLPTKARGGVPTKGTVGRRDLRPFMIPHIPHDDVIKAEDIQGVRAYGSLNPTTYEEVYTRKMMTMRRKFEITWEYLKAGALQGRIIDADGSLIYDLFAEFGITQEVVNFEFSDPSFSVLDAIRQVKRYITLHLFGEVSNGRVEARVSSEFMSALLQHPSVEKAYQYFTTAGEINPLRDDAQDSFTYGGMTFLQYLANTTDLNGNPIQFMADDTGVAYPQGTQDTFKTYWAPGDFLETVNDRGLPLYVKQQPDKWNRGVEILMESNPLPMCRRPQLLVKLTMS